jgi:hypothetical protein
MHGRSLRGQSVSSAQILGWLSAIKAQSLVSKIRRCVATGSLDRKGSSASQDRTVAAHLVRGFSSGKSTARANSS